MHTRGEKKTGGLKTALTEVHLKPGWLVTGQAGVDLRLNVVDVAASDGVVSSVVTDVNALHAAPPTGSGSAPLSGSGRT